MLEVAAGLRPSPPACAAQRGARREDGACLAASVSCHGPEQLDACRQLPPARLRPRRLLPHSCRGQCIVSNSLETVTVKDTRGTLAVPPHSWPPWPPQPWTAAAAIAVGLVLSREAAANSVSFITHVGLVLSWEAACGVPN